MLPPPVLSREMPPGPDDEILPLLVSAPLLFAVKDTLVPLRLAPAFNTMLPPVALIAPAVTLPFRKLMVPVLAVPPPEGVVPPPEPVVS